jgi:hypothetical protein
MREQLPGDNRHSNAGNAHRGQTKITNSSSDAVLRRQTHYTTLHAPVLQEADKRRNTSARSNQDQRRLCNQWHRDAGDDDSVDRRPTQYAALHHLCCRAK